jgi:DNA polymerase-3 subunit delta'
MSFKDIKGHAGEIEQIKSMIRNKRIPHALLFSGPEGIGKKKVALELVKYLNCENPDTREVLSCQQCPSCLRIEGGRQPELFIIEDSEGSIKLEQVKNMASLLSLKSNLSNYKAIIIDNSQLLRAEAANSLLKIIEEPGEKTIFILITSNENMLLPTIRSRVQRISFQALSEEDLRILADDHKLYSDKLDFLLSYAQGSFGKLEGWLKDSDFLEELRNFQELFPAEDNLHLFSS